MAESSNYRCSSRNLIRLYLLEETIIGIIHLLCFYLAVDMCIRQQTKLMVQWSDDRLNRYDTYRYDIWRFSSFHEAKSIAEEYVVAAKNYGVIISFRIFKSFGAFQVL